MKFTGERYLPSLTWPQIAFEHWHRYFAAASMATGKEVLDIACGIGYGSHLLSQQARRVVGVDVDPATISCARDKYSAPNLNFLAGDCGHIPIPGQAVFDLIVSFETIEHVAADVQKSFLSEVKRLLKPGGLFLVSTPNKHLNTPPSTLPNPYHLHELTPDDFKLLMRQHFGTVRFFGQKVYPSSFIWDLEQNTPRQWREYGLEFSAGEYRPSPSAKEAHYLLAICSDTDISDNLPSVLLDISEQYAAEIRRLEQNIRGLTNQIHALEEHNTTISHLLRDTRLQIQKTQTPCQIERDPREAEPLSPAAQRLQLIENSISWRCLERVQRMVDPILLPALHLRNKLTHRLKSPVIPNPAPVPLEPVSQASELTALTELHFPQETTPRVSIVIPLFNQWQLTYRCLESMVRHPAGMPIEIIVVDDGSSDATPDILKKVHGISVIRNATNHGFIYSCNAGIQHAHGEFVLFLNNDTEVTKDWLLHLVSPCDHDAKVGAVGAKLVWPTGLLMEAGSIIWNDGSTTGYGRNGDPDHPAYNYVREVDYCSGACLLVRRDLLSRIGGFDSRFAPAYCEDVDLCLTLKSLGYRVLYQPRTTIIHHENGSSSFAEARDHMVINQRRIQQKWHTELRHKPSCLTQNQLLARDSRTGKRILVIDDAVPAPHLGSGYPRAQHMLKSLGELGYVCTFFPLLNPQATEPYSQELRDLGIEVFAGASISLDSFLNERKGLYDIVLVSRPHNAEAALDKVRQYLPSAWIIYDAEAIYAAREILRHDILGLPLNAESRLHLLEQEASLMRKADAVLTVSEAERQAIEQLNVFPVHVYGTPTPVFPPVNDFENRKDILFVGGFLTEGCPNEDSMIHFVREVFPLVQKELQCRLIIAGTNRLDSIRSLATENILVTGQVEDLRPYYEQSRIFIVPTRFASGSAQKLHDAMAQGLPSVVSPLIAKQMGYPDGHALLVGEDPASFAAQIITLYRDRVLWQKIQREALSWIRNNCNPATLKSILQDIINDTIMDESSLPAAVSAAFPIRRLPEERSLMVRLDLTNNCNLACRQCTLRDNRRGRNEPAGEIDFDMFKRIADQIFPYAASVALSCEAEPLLHSRFSDIMQVIAEHPGPLYKITTNGQLLLQAENAQALFSGHVGEIYLSIDGATPTTYENIRQGGSFHRLEEGIRRLNQLKAERGAGQHESPLLQVNYTLMASTLHELPHMVELCREWKIDRLILQHLYGLEVNKLKDESLMNSPEESDAILQACRKQCLAYGIRTLFPRPFNAQQSWMDAPKQPLPPANGEALDCYAPWRMVRVRWNGDVYPCDLWPQPIMGNLHNQSFPDIWNSTPYLRLRWGHARHFTLHPNCRRCTVVTTENIEGRNIQAPVAFTPAQQESTLSQNRNSP